MTVTFSTRPVGVGTLTASISTDGVTSGAALQVATIIPAITSSTANLGADANSIVINGFAFDTTASRNVLVFNNGAVGTVTSATRNALTVTFTTKPSSAGPLTASVTVNGVASGTAVQIATVVPVVTSAAANLAANSATLVINGFGFDPTAANNSVTFNNGVVGTVTTATKTALTVTFSTRPSTVGSLTAIVTTNTRTSGSAVQVATVVPSITANTANLATGTTTLTIAGFGFDSTITNNSITFSNGAVGIITAATSTSLNITFAALPDQAGPMTAVVVSRSFSSGTPVTVATILPVVNQTTTNVAASANTVTISGSNFSPVPADNTVVFNNGATGTVTSATKTLLTVTFATKPFTAGPLTAIVTTRGSTSGAAVQIATVTPVVTSSTAAWAFNGTNIVISGFGFDPVAANNTVVFNNGAVGTVTSATKTSLTVTFATKPTNLGSLTAIVTTNTLTSGSATQVAVVAPAVATATASLAANANTITISGAGFSTTAGNNTVVFNNGAVGTVTAATATSLTVTFSTKPTTAGPLTAVVTTNGFPSASVQVATVAPVVTASTANLAITASTMTINGFGFSTTAANNRIVFNNGAVGVVTAATATTLTVSFTTKPKAVGLLTAIVTTNSVVSGVAIQVATVV